MPLFIAFVLGIALVVIFNQRKSNQVYKVDIERVTRVKEVVRSQLKDHFSKCVGIKLTELNRVCVCAEQDHDVEIKLARREFDYLISFKRGKAKDSFTITRSVVHEVYQEHELLN